MAGLMPAMTWFSNRTGLGLLQEHQQHSPAQVTVAVALLVLQVQLVQSRSKPGCPLRPTQAWLFVSQNLARLPASLLWCLRSALWPAAAAATGCLMTMQERHSSSSSSQQVL